MTVYPKLSLKYEFEITDVGGETVAVCLEDSADSYHGIIKLQNEPAVFMFGKLKEGIALPALIIKCMEKYSEPVEQAGPAVMEFINRMAENGLIKSEPVTPEGKQ